MLKVTIRDGEEITVFRCKGRIVAGEDTRTLRDGISRANGRKLLVLDLAQVNAIDAAGLGLLVFLHTSASIAGMEMKLLNPTQRIRKLLALTNLDSVFGICLPADLEIPSRAERTRAPELTLHVYAGSQ